MPWKCDCKDDPDRFDNENSCPNCNAAKNEWSVGFERTRTLVVGSVSPAPVSVVFNLKKGNRVDYAVGERYELRFADGTTLSASTVKYGLGKHECPDEGPVTVRFPDRTPDELEGSVASELGGAQLVLTPGSKATLQLLQDPKAEEILSPGRRFTRRPTGDVRKGSVRPIQEFWLEQGKGKFGWKHIWDRHVDPTRKLGKSKFDIDASLEDILNFLGKTFKHGVPSIFEGRCVYTSQRIHTKFGVKRYRVTVEPDGTIVTFHPLDGQPAPPRKRSADEQLKHDLGTLRRAFEASRSPENEAAYLHALVHTGGGKDQEVTWEQRQRLAILVGSQNERSTKGAVERRGTEVNATRTKEQDAKGKDEALQKERTLNRQDPANFITWKQT
jgi:hypothetical protein